MKNLIINIPFQGFYESLFSVGLDQAEEFTVNYEVEEKGRNPSKCADAFYKTSNHRKAHLYVAQKYVEYFNDYIKDEFGLDLGLAFESLQSPREYNFETDRVFCFISPENAHKLRARVSDEELQIAIKQRFTSRSGFISSYVNDLRGWQVNVENWDHNELGTLLVALLGEGGDWERDIYEEMQDHNVFDTAFDNCVDWDAYENFVMEEE
jgi:hypothetical protein